MPELKYLALGDSYTVGEGVPADARWTCRLAAALRRDGVPLADPRTIAATGWTTDELEAAIDAAAPAQDQDFVSLLIGVNNQYRGRGVDEYAEQFAGLLERAIGLAGSRTGRVLVLSIPDWGATAFGRASGRDLARVSREIDAFNEAARRICAGRDVAFVDIAPVSRERGGEADMLAADGLHPSAAMYALWAELALPAARALLRPR